MPVFKTGAINSSATSPIKLYFELCRFPEFQASIWLELKSGSTRLPLPQFSTLLLALKFIGQCAHSINLAQGLDHPG